VLFVKRGFWAHQLVEYLLGIGAIATGAQSPKPLFPCIAGGLLLLNGASTEGPLAAFKLIPRRLHRFGDIVVVLFMVIAALVAGDSIDSSGRVVLLGLAGVHTFVTLRTDYSKRAPREPKERGAPDSEEIGRMAGHLSGKAYNAVRRKGAVAQDSASSAASSVSKVTSEAAQTAGRASANLLNALKERKKD
jgi:hypothetical protein